MPQETRRRIRDLYAVDGADYEEPRLREARGLLLSEYDQRLFQEMLPALSPHTEALEVGAGTGRFTELLLGSELRLTATDINDTMLETLRQRVERAGADDRVDVRNEDAFNLSFDAEQFGLVYSIHMIPRFVTWDDQSGALSEMIRVLKPGGWLLFNYRNGRSLNGLMHSGYSGSPGPVNALLEASGMRVIDKRGKWFLTRRLLDRMPLFAGRMVAGLDRAFLRVTPDYAWDVFILAQKT